MKQACVWCAALGKRLLKSVAAVSKCSNYVTNESVKIVNYVSLGAQNKKGPEGVTGKE